MGQTQAVRRLGLRWAAIVAWLGSVLAVLLWAEAGQVDSAASVTIAGFVLGLSFAATAVLLAGQEGQASNTRWLGAMTLIWLANEVSGRGLGVLTAPLAWLGGFIQVAATGFLLRYPGTRLDRLGKVYFLGTVSLFVIVQTLLVVTGRPEWWQPRKSPETPWWSPFADPAAHNLVWDVRYGIEAVAGALFLLLLARRWRTLGLLERKALAPILLVAATTGVLVALRPVQASLSDELGVVLDLMRTYSAAALSLALVVSALQMKLAQSAVGVLAAELSQSATVDGVRDALRRALGDRHLEVWYWMPEQAAYVDGAGVTQPAPEGSSRLVASVEATDGRPMAVVLADPMLRRHRVLLDSAVAVSRLALENAQLQASLKSQLVEVREARSRLLHAGLEERRRLERDLHDGAQQRLVALGLRLGAIESTTRDEALKLAVRAVREDLHEALGELRDLAHGLYPAVLSQSGLGAALEAVVERLPVPVQASIQPGRWSPDVEGAGYLIACEALANACKHAGPCSIRLDIAQSGPDLVIEVSDDGLGSEALQGDASVRSIRDRVDTMGGRVQVTSTPGVGTTMRAAIPCG